MQGSNTNFEKNQKKKRFDDEVQHTKNKKQKKNKTSNKRMVELYL